MVYVAVNYEVKLEDGTVIAKADAVEFTVQDGNFSSLSWNVVRHFCVSVWGCSNVQLL